MSINATFVQVDEIRVVPGLQADPSLAEPLFEDQPLAPPALARYDEGSKQGSGALRAGTGIAGRHA